MVHKADLVIIGVSVGVAVGILIACLVFFAIRWYKRRANLRRCANERSAATLPIRVNGLGTSVDFSASISTTISIKEPEHHSQGLQHSWWGHHSKDRFVSASGIPRYSHKCVIYH